MLHSLRIVDYGLGHPGSSHDSYAFKETQIYQQHDTYLADNEWIWVDSAYPLSTWLVLSFKKPRNQALNRDQRTFNYFLSKVISILCNLLFAYGSRFRFRWNMHLVHSKATFNHFKSCKFPLAPKKTLIMPQTGLSVA